MSVEVATPSVLRIFVHYFSEREASPHDVRFLALRNKNIVLLSVTGEHAQEDMRTQRRFVSVVCEPHL